jgi:hypothetical protein
VENGPFIIWFAIVMTNKLNTVYLISLAHGVTFFFNSGHRHANRRGPPRGMKETEISASTSDGKTSKRGTASYSAHEVQWFCIS